MYLIIRVWEVRKNVFAIIEEDNSYKEDKNFSYLLFFE